MSIKREDYWFEGKMFPPQFELDGLSCQYCKEDDLPASLPVSKVIFEVIFKDGRKVRVCPVCLYEHPLEVSEEIDKITNIGEW